MLISAISEIPDTSFVDSKRADQERRELLSKAKEIERELSFCTRMRVKGNQDDRDKTGCLSGALEATLALRHMVERELNDSIETTNLLQETKAEVLSTTDFALTQTIPDRTVHAQEHSFRIRLIPDELEKIIGVSAVTQGAHGSVEILRDGFVLYSPQSETKQTDTFTATLTDEEGASVTKTVTVVKLDKDHRDGDQH